MYLDPIEITREQEAYCRKWLREFYKVELQITNTSLFSEATLLRMLKLELSDRQRKNVVTRLEARINKLRRQRERAEIAKILGKDPFNSSKGYLDA